MASPEPGFERLRGRKERFAVLLSEGMPQGRAYLESVDPPLEATAGRQVSASRLAGTDAVQQRVAFLKRQRAADAAPLSDLTTADVSAIMSEISDLLIESAMLAEQSGHDNLSVSLRAAALAHHNRSARVQRVQGDTSEKAEAYDAAAALERILCQC